jgi:hypothetical protein
VLRRFWGDAEGSLSIEAAIMVPTLAFAMSLMYTAFDAFRFDATNSKAAYTIGDLFSRETDPVDQDFIDGMKDIFDYITLSDPADTWLRVSVVRYDGDDDELKLLWSHVDGNVTALTQDTLVSIADQIPDMSEEDTVIVVETSMNYVMKMQVGIPDFAFRNLVVTRPRFSSQLCWETCT